MSRRVGRLLLGSLLGAALLVPAWLLISTTFMLYDDEGYVLSTLRSFLDGGRLYDEIFSQYGPVPYLYHGLLVPLLQAPLTHQLGRALTAVHWAACGLLAGALALRLSGRSSTGLLGAMVTFALLWQMTSEPSHPGSLIAVLVAVAGLLAAGLSAAARPLTVAAALGALAALLVFTKVNVGLLLVAGLGALALRDTAWPARWNTPASVAAALGLLALPWVLMAKRLEDPRVLMFASQFTLAAAGLCWVLPAGARRLTPRTWLAALAGFVATGGLVVVAILLRGTSPAALLDAVLLHPLRHPANFLVPFSWPAAVWPVAVGAGVLAARAGWERRRGGLRPLTAQLVAAARLAAFGFFLVHASRWPTISGIGAFIAWCLPLLPVFTVPLDERDSTGALGGAALIALPQVLHAYPIAGSQMGWGVFLCVPVFVAGVDSAVRRLAGSLSGPMPGRLSAVWTAVGLVVGGGQWWLLTHEGWTRYHESRPLDLPGAAEIRLSGAPRESLRLLTLNAALHADVLFSRPGMFSYNLWSGVPTPTRRNATHWFWLLSADEQRDIVARLESTSRRAIITNRLMEDFLTKINVAMDGPLQTHLQAGYRPLFAFDDFTLLVPEGSRAAPFGKITLLGAEAVTPGGPPPVMLRANLLLDGQPVAVHLERLDPPWTRTVDLCPPGTRAWLEPINRFGETTGAPIALPATAPVKGMFRLTIFRDAGPPAISSPTEVALFVRDAADQILAEAVF